MAIRDILVQLILRDIRTWWSHFLHCGDSINDDRFIISTNDGCASNMDFNGHFPDKWWCQIGAQRLFNAWSLYGGVNFDLTRLMLAAQAEGAPIGFLRLHQVSLWNAPRALGIKSGSISQPRGQFQPAGGTYAVVDIGDDYPSPILWHICWKSTTTPI